MTVHAWRLPVTLDPLIAEAKRRARQRRALVGLGVVLLLAGLAAGLTLALRSTGGGQSGGLATASYPRYDISFRYPSELTRVGWCGEWSNLPGGGINAIALITTGRAATNCYTDGNLPPQWPPLAVLGRNGVSVALARVETWPGTYTWHGRLTAAPTDYGATATRQRLTGWPFGCPAGVPNEIRSVAIRSRDRPEVVSVDALICGPDFATGRATFRQVVASLRFER